MRHKAARVDNKVNLETKKYKMYQVIVNNETFDDYDDAEAYVDQILYRI